MNDIATVWAFKFILVILTPLPLWHRFSFYGNFYKVSELHLCLIDPPLFSMHFFLLCGQPQCRRSHTWRRMDAPQSMHHGPVSMPVSMPVEPRPILHHASPCGAPFWPVPQHSRTTQPPCRMGAGHGSGGIGWGGSSARGGVQSGEGVLSTTRPPMSKGASIKPLGDLFQGFQ